MGLWTRTQREQDKKWAIENSDRICRLYLDGYSILELQRLKDKNRGTSRADIEAVLKANEIPLRGFTRTPRYQQKVEETSLLKFGEKNASSALAIKTKREQTFLTRYGVKNPFELAAVKEKIAQTNFIKYGHQNVGCISRRGRTSKIHLILSDALKIAGVEHENEVFIGAVTARGKAKFLDIVIRGTHVVEVFGDYYHANPKKYNSTDKIRVFQGFLEAQTIWERDRERLSGIKYPTLVVWECEIKSDLAGTVSKIKDWVHHESDKHQKFSNT